MSYIGTNRCRDVALDFPPGSNASSTHKIRFFQLRTKIAEMGSLRGQLYNDCMECQKTLVIF